MGNILKNTVVITLLLCWLTAGYAAEFTGTYGHLEFHEESGDLSGIELKVIYSNDGYYLLFQSASGVPSIPVLMRLNIDNKIFMVKIPEGTDYGGAILKGQFNSKGINAEFTNGPIFSNGKKNDILEKTTSYWD